MFKKKGKQIFFILYLKKRFEKMSSQDNANQIINSTNVEDLFNEDENVDIDNKNEIYLNSLSTGKYNMFFSYFHVVHLFIKDKHYCINSYESSNIYYKINNIWKLKSIKEEKNKVIYDVYENVILEVESKDEKISIYVRILDEKGNVTKGELITSYNSLSENARYEDFIIDDVNDKLIINEEKYNLPPKIKDFYQNYCTCKKGKIYITINKKLKLAKLTLITGKYATINKNKYLKLNILVTVDGKKWLYYIRDNIKPFSHINEQKKNNEENNEENNEDNTENNEENNEDNAENNEEDNEEDNTEDNEEDNVDEKPHIHAIVGIYTVGACCYGYDIQLDKYIDLKYYISKIEQYINIEDKNEYKYFQLNGKRKGLLITRKFNKETNRNKTSIELISIEALLDKAILDITTIKNKHKAGVKEEVTEVTEKEGDLLSYVK